MSYDTILNAIENRKEEIISIGEWIFKNPETGFKELKTAKYVAEWFEKLDLKYTKCGDIPGLKVTLDTGKPGPGVAILGELDAVVCHEHPDCDKETGAVHACGHNAQVAAMLGAAIGILDSDIISELIGKIHFIAVPAEEYIEIEYRKELRQKGIIKYLGGKPEMLYRGFFDDVDICMMIHSFCSTEKKVAFEATSNGCIVKKVKYMGKASHAGGAPHNGINALYAANLGMMAINSIRETFKEDDYIRVHPIITKGGDIVNIIPCDVRLETFVRGKTMDGIIEANKKVNRALAGGAFAIGTKVEIEDMPGYFPLTQNKDLISLLKKITGALVNEDEVLDYSGHRTGSTDMGDLSSLMPVVHPYIGGITGIGHGSEYKITDPDTAYVLSSKLLACAAVELLRNDASAATEIINNFKPIFSSKEEYFKFADELFDIKIFPDNEYLD